MGKGEIARSRAISPFTTMFSRSLTLRTESNSCLLRGNVPNSGTA